MHELAKHKPVVLIPAEENLKRYWRELRKIGDDATLVDKEHPYYVESRIIIIDQNMLHEQVTKKERVTFKVNQPIDLEQLIKRLEATGYTREENVEEENEYSTRGGIVDLFEAESYPIRIELYGDRVFSMRKFDTQTQRSIENIERFEIRLGEAERKSRRPIDIIIE